jgi:hypothetical protein
MSACPLVLPYVWATFKRKLPVAVHAPQMPPRPQLAFYRKYTEALLRRYVRMSMEAGRVPSLLKQEMFRGKITSYQVDAFDDVVIFLADVDRCIARLDANQQLLITCIALQEFTIGEAAEILHIPHRTVIRQYTVALDRLTRIFLDNQMLKPQNYCQAIGSSK